MLLSPEEGEELPALPFGEPADRLALADAALLHDLRRLDAPALGRRHQYVDDLGGLEKLGRIGEHVADAHFAPLEVALERRAQATHAIGSLERIHPLVE